MTDTPRSDGRGRDALRPVHLFRSCLRQPAGSALVHFGGTHVLCAATIEEGVPSFLRGTGEGWVTAEYGMLPASVPERAPRNKVSGRSQEIQRLIGRSLRAVVDRKALGERTIFIDCDVLEADGGTRTAAITGAYVALREAVDRLRERALCASDPIQDSVAAVSVGLLDGSLHLDLCYEEDVRAQVDFNVVATGAGRLIEVQGTAEHGTFSERESRGLVRLALRGIRRLTRLQARALAAPPPKLPRLVLGKADP